MKKAIFVSNNEEYFSALAIAFECSQRIKLFKYEGKYINKNYIVIYLLDESNNFDSWFWNDFRKRTLNPLVVIGAEDEETFIKKHSVFKKYQYAHEYFPLFKFKQLMATVLTMRPIFNQDTRREIVRREATGFEWQLIDHDLKIIKNDKGKTLANLLAVRDFYQSKGDTETLKLIKTRLIEFDRNPDWARDIFVLKQELLDRYKRRNDKT